MKTLYIFLAASLGILAACSGLEKDIPEVVTEDSEITEIVFNVPPVIDDDVIETKASAVRQSDYKVTFAWEETDKIGIFPNKGSQIYFVPEDGVGTSSASFDGGGWALKSNSTYISYYPFVADFDLDRNAIPISFAGQKQTGTEGPFDDSRWVLATSSTTSLNGRLTFTYNILNTIINVIATLPAGTYTSASLNIAEPLFVEEGTFSLDNQAITGTTFSKKLEIELEDFTLTENAEVPIYFMAAPVDLTGKEITVIITKDDGSRYKCVKTPSGAYNAGHRRGLSCAMQKDADIINFVDPAVKALCVANWDTDGDGELDMDEAAAVTDLGNVFYQNTDITSFDELQYFTGLTSIGKAYPDEGWEDSMGFGYCRSLASVILPESISLITQDAFYNTNLTSISIPEGTILYSMCFGNTGIESLVLQGCTLANNTGMGGPLVSMPSLTSLSLTGPTTIHNSNGFISGSPINKLSFGETFSWSFTSSGNQNYYPLNSLGFVFWGVDGENRIEEIVISPENVEYDSRDNCNALIETSTNTLLLGCKNTVIPESVTAIGPYAFCAMNSSEPFSVTVPASVVSIGSMAFATSANWLDQSSPYSYSVTFLATIPPILEDDIFSCYYYDDGERVNDNNLFIYVPAGSVNTYKTADGWSDYADRIFSIEGGTVPNPGDDGND